MADSDFKSKPGVPETVQLWDVPVRLFHWVNFFTVIVLCLGGLVVMNIAAIGMSSDGALLFKVIHVWAGYVFTLNLAIRLIWLVTGPPAARWTALLPDHRGILAGLTEQINAIRCRRAARYETRSPGGKLSVILMFGIFLLLAVTGIVLAGTDIYYPPLGAYFAEWVAAPGIDPVSVVPYDPAVVNESAFYEVREFRKPYIWLHVYAFYVLLALIVMHIAAVVDAELRGEGSLVSAMISGIKYLPARTNNRRESSDRPVHGDDSS